MVSLAYNNRFCFIVLNCTRLSPYVANMIRCVLRSSDVNVFGDIVRAIAYDYVNHPQGCAFIA